MRCCWPQCCCARRHTADLFTAQLAYHKGDYEHAFKDYRDLAELGQPLAQYNVAVMYAKGRACGRAISTPTRGRRWLRRTAIRAARHSRTSYARTLRTGSEQIAAEIARAVQPREPRCAS